MGLLYWQDDVNNTLIKPIFDYKEPNDDDEYYRLGYYDCQLKKNIGPYAVGTKIDFIEINFATGKITFLKLNSNEDEVREKIYETDFSLSF